MLASCVSFTGGIGMDRASCQNSSSPDPVAKGVALNVASPSGEMGLGLEILPLTCSLFHSSCRVTRHRRMKYTASKKQTSRNRAVRIPNQITRRWVDMVKKVVIHVHVGSPPD